jgi:hypothetical protein
MRFLKFVVLIFLIGCFGVAFATPSYIGPYVYRGYSVNGSGAAGGFKTEEEAANAGLSAIEKCYTGGNACNFRWGTSNVSDWGKVVYLLLLQW